jgi:hypothetical protein
MRTVGSLKKVRHYSQHLLIALATAARMIGRRCGTPALFAPRLRGSWRAEATKECPWCGKPYRQCLCRCGCPSRRLQTSAGENSPVIGCAVMVFVTSGRRWLATLSSEGLLRVTNAFSSTRAMVRMAGTGDSYLWVSGQRGKHCLRRSCLTSSQLHQQQAPGYWGSPAR